MLLVPYTLTSYFRQKPVTGECKHKAGCGNNKLVKEKAKKKGEALELLCVALQHREFVWTVFVALQHQESRQRVCGV